MSTQFSGHQDYYPSRGAAADTRTSTIVVAASNSLDPTLAPLLYRCTGANDEVEIIAALTAAVAVGGEVVLLEGLYVTAAPIVFPGGSLALTGLGRASLIRPAGAAGNAITVTGRDDVIIRDLAIDTKTSASGGHGVFIEDGSDRFFVENVWIVDSDADGIRVEGTTINDGHIHSCHVEAADVSGIVVDMDGANFAYRFHIYDNTVQNCGAYGIGLDASGGNNYCQIVNNIVNNCTGDGIALADGDYSMICANISVGGSGNGIDLRTTDHAVILGNLCQDNNLVGILLTTVLDTTVTGNIIEGNSGGGIQLAGSSGNTLAGNTCQDNTNNGISLTASAYYNTVTGNTCNENSTSGISLSTGVRNTITGNTCRLNGFSGIDLGSTSSYNTITGNTCNQNVGHGIRLTWLTSYCVVVGNSCNGNDSGDTNSYDGICIETNADYNLVMGNSCNENDRWGISIGIASDDCVGNWVKDNFLRSNTSGAFLDNGTDTKLATIPIPLIQGTTFVSAAGEAWGWEINLADEFALGIGWLPLEVQQIVRIRIIGVALEDPGPGNEMRAQFTGEAATFHEPFATNPIDVVDKDSEETDPDVGDVIQWILTATDDADIANIVGGDRLQLKVLYEDPENGSIATDAIIDTIQVEYV